MIIIAEVLIKTLAQKPEIWQDADESYKKEMAIRGANYLVIQIEEKLWPGKRSLWHFWKRVKKSEAVANEIARMLSNQALWSGDSALYSFWTQVMVSLKSGEYLG